MLSGKVTRASDVTYIFMNAGMLSSIALRSLQKIKLVRKTALQDDSAMQATFRDDKADLGPALRKHAPCFIRIDRRGN